MWLWHVCPNDRRRGPLLGTVSKPLVGAQALHNAAPFLSAFGHAVVAWLRLDQAVTASGAMPLHVGKRRACRFFYEFELPKVAPLLATVASLTDVAAGVPQEAF